MNDVKIDPTRLKRIVSNQKALLWSIFGLLAFGMLAGILRDETASVGIGTMATVFVLLYLIANIIAVISTILLAANAYNSVLLGILLALVVLVPCIGLLMLLAINQRACMILKANGIKVGFMGADMSQFKNG